MACERPPAASRLSPCIRGESGFVHFCGITLPLVKGESREAAGSRSQAMPKFLLPDQMLRIHVEFIADVFVDFPVLEQGIRPGEGVRMGESLRIL